MHIYMKHPTHGTKVAISEVEVEFDKTHGWEVFDPEAKRPDPEPEPKVKLPVKPAPKVAVGV